MLYDIEKDEIITTKGTFFRKLFPLHSKSLERERQVIERLKGNPHPNIVSYYTVTDRYIDMELLTPLDKDSLADILPVMENVKSFLQGICIYYVDWKMDNLAKGSRGYTLIDFDSSGIADRKDSTLEPNGLNPIVWTLEPTGWSYQQAKKTCATPKEIDDWSFDYNLVKPSYQKMIRNMDYTYPEYLPSNIESNTYGLETQIACETGGLIYE
jgi:hypothetical protein